ncbi:unnamed protein product [Pleuronectes platessa]|uniref:Uncharacterized protein n=1 Tax=Pleuronectes platessa TaxID=8262 RepID=A0A9N7VLS1_PLEPL|nr:unnamed protein product [Pleuronectes platessa]
MAAGFNLRLRGSPPNKGERRQRRRELLRHSNGSSGSLSELRPFVCSDDVTTHILITGGRLLLGGAVSFPVQRSTEEVEWYVHYPEGFGREIHKFRIILLLEPNRCFGFSLGPARIIQRPAISHADRAQSCDKGRKGESPRSQEKQWLPLLISLTAECCSGL